MMEKEKSVKTRPAAWDTNVTMRKVGNDQWEIDRYAVAGNAGSDDARLLAIQNGVVFLIFAVTLILSVLIELYAPSPDKHFITLSLTGIASSVFVIGIIVVNWDVKVIENGAGDPLYGRLVKRTKAAPWILVVMTVFPLCIVVIITYLMFLAFGRDYV